jgi:RNA polymerase sigma-70 factor, ECF subfamily
MVGSVARRQGATVNHRGCGGARNEDLDRKLVLAYRSGDQDAFSTIFDNHNPQLLAQARALLGQSGGAEDACQETFRRALEGIGRFGRRGEWRVGAWLSTILHNVCVDQLASAHRDQVLASAMSGETVNGTEVVDRGADPGEMIAVKDAIRHLRPALARALVMREVQGLSYAELAEAEHISEECARTRASRARRMVQRELAS